MDKFLNILGRVLKQLMIIIASISFLIVFVVVVIIQSIFDNNIKQEFVINEEGLAELTLPLKNRYVYNLKGLKGCIDNDNKEIFKINTSINHSSISKICIGNKQKLCNLKIISKSKKEVKVSVYTQLENNQCEYKDLIIKPIKEYIATLDITEDIANQLDMELENGEISFKNTKNHEHSHFFVDNSYDIRYKIKPTTDTLLLNKKEYIQILFK